MGRAVRALMALVVAGMLALTGCAGQNPTHAASVNGVVITEDQVGQIAQGLATVAGTPDAAGEQRQTAASILIRNEVGRQVAQQNGVTISEADREAVLATAPQLTQMSQEPALTTFIDDYINSELTRTQLGETEFAAAAETVEVTLNPRYGAWDTTQGMLTGESGSLSSPAPAPTTNA